jgi:hypothetical protein
VTFTFDSTAATEIGPLDAPDDVDGTVDQRSSDVVEYSLQPENGDPSESSDPSQ